MEKADNRHINYVNVTMSDIHKYNDHIQRLIPELYEALIDKEDEDGRRICNQLTQYQSKLNKVIKHIRADLKE